MEPDRVEELRRLLELSPVAVDAETRSRAERLRGRLWPAMRRELGEWTPARSPGIRTPATDAELIPRLRARDPEAFDRLFELHGASLLAYAERSLQTHDAEDAVQEAWLDLVRKAELIPERVELLPWLLGFVRHAVKRSLRRALALEPLPDDRPDGRADEAELHALRGEDFERLAAAMASLNALEQEVVLGFLASDSTEAIAAAQELRVGHVRVLKHRASKKLKAILGERP